MDRHNNKNIHYLANFSVGVHTKQFKHWQFFDSAPFEYCDILVVHGTSSSLEEEPNPIPFHLWKGSITS